MGFLSIIPDETGSRVCAQEKRHSYAKIRTSMARKKKRSRKSNRGQEAFLGLELNPETKRGIGVIFLFAIAALIFLSFFQMAGSLGVAINSGLSIFFGLDRFLVPIVIIIIGASMAYPDRGVLSIWNYIGLLFFFLSFNALINFFLFARPEPITQDLTLAGGYLGQFLGTLLPAFIGYWGAILASSALLLISILLIFNTSLRSIAGVHTHITGWFGALLHRDTLRNADDPEEDWEDEEEEDEVPDEEEDEEEDEVTDEEEDEDEDEHEFTAKPVPTPERRETVLISSQQRTIKIPMKLLLRGGAKATSGDIDRNKDIIEKTFNEFGIDVEMGKTSVGPTVTQFTLRPAQGIKISRIVSLQNDLALALAAHPLRMEAPIPGKSLVGIEVPNTKVATVTLRDVIETKNFKASESPLSVPLGKDVSGNSHVIELDRMPHMLVAGCYWIW